MNISKTIVVFLSGCYISSMIWIFSMFSCMPHEIQITVSVLAFLTVGGCLGWCITYVITHWDKKENFL